MLLSIYLLVDIWSISTFWGYYEWCSCEHSWVWGVFVRTIMFSLLLGRYQGVELLDHMVILCSPFWETTNPFSTVAVPCYDPTSNAWWFKSLLTLIIFPFLDYGHLKKGFDAQVLLFKPPFPLSFHSLFPLPPISQHSFSTESCIILRTLHTVSHPILTIALIY